MTSDLTRRALVSALVVSYNVRSYVLDTLRAYYATCGHDASAIVVDNASTDGSVDAIQQAFPNAKSSACRKTSDSGGPTMRGSTPAIPNWFCF